MNERRVMIHMMTLFCSNSQKLDSRLTQRYNKKLRFGTCKFKLRAKCQTLRFYKVILRIRKPHIYSFLFLLSSGYQF